MDFRRLKQSIFSNSSSRIEKVEVNQRHLIDKILARYSAEFTVYREMIQNANDAEAERVEVMFHTSPSASNKTMIKGMIIRNDGRAFCTEDWRRLKRIAEGNPDEKKIGFFGVGFYSLFSICEEPLIISGQQCLSFQWDGDQLCTQSASYDAMDEGWTSICLELRESLELPDLDRFTQFLGKSLLFTNFLKSISFSVDDRLMAQFTKTPSSFNPTSATGMKFKGAQGIFSLETPLQAALIQLTLDKRYTSLEDPKPSNSSSSPSLSSLLSGIWKFAQSHLTEQGREESALTAQLRLPGTFSVFYKQFRGDALVKTSTKFADEMERTTKKRPFKQVTLDIIYCNWDEVQAATYSTIKEAASNAATTETPGNSIQWTKTHPVLSQLLPNSSSRGKVFIGFETHQTTGLNVHLTAPFIPTVERESIDFVDGCLRQWNLELLQLAGWMLRIIYDSETEAINQQLKSSYLGKARHLMESFNFQESTPSPIIGFSLFNEFLASRDFRQLKLPSAQKGFVAAAQLRHIPDEMMQFVKVTPKIPDEIASVCKAFLKKLASHKGSEEIATIPTISPQDVINWELLGLGERQSQEESAACLKWWLNYIKHTPISGKLVQEFSSSFKVPSAQITSGGDGSKWLPLGQISCYLGDPLVGLYNSEKATIRYFPLDSLSPSFSTNFETQDLTRYLRLEELSLMGWLEGLLRWSEVKNVLESDAEKSEQLLMFLSKYYQNLNSDLDRSRICNCLANLKCIPAGQGEDGTSSISLKRPNECFFEGVPALQASQCFLKFSTEARRSRVSEDLLKGAGVLAHLPLEKIFSSLDRLKWDHASLLKYLLKTRSELSKSDLQRLRSAAIFPDSNDAGLHRLENLFSASFKTSPLTEILSLKILKWPEPSTDPREGSELGEFLRELGLNYLIPWKMLLKGVKGVQLPSQRFQIFQYFFQNYAKFDEFNPEAIDFPFIPVDDDSSLLLKPNQLFLDSPLKHLNFYLIHPDLRNYAHLLGVQEHPNGQLIASQLTTVPLPSNEAAREVFSYCSRIANVFTEADLRLLRQHPFIPIESQRQYRAFDQVFLASNELSSLFDLVDFGPQGNSFLRIVGVRDEPQAENLLDLLLKDSHQVLSILQPKKYIELLERLAQQWSSIVKKFPSKAKAFATSKALIGFTKNERSSENEESDLATDAPSEGADSTTPSTPFVTSLFTRKEVFLIDDTVAYQIFNLPSSPESLESFYLELGCSWLSAVIKSEWQCRGTAQSNTPLAKSMNSLIKERLGLVISSLEEASASSDSKIIKGGRKRLESTKFFQVDSIEIIRKCTLNGRENSQRSSAFTDAATAHPSIYLASNGNFDYFDLAAVICMLLCDKRAKLQDSLLIASLLTTPLHSLQAKGFRIDLAKPEEKSISIAPKPSVDESVTTCPEPKSPQATTTTESDSLIKHKPHESLRTNTKSPSPSTASSNSVKSSLRKLGEGIMGILKKTPSESDVLGAGKAGEGRDSESLRTALERGIKSLKPRPQSDFTTEQELPQGVAAPPQNPQIRKEINEYCRIASQLRPQGQIGGVVIYATDSMTAQFVDAFLSQNHAPLSAFYGMIVDVLGRQIFQVNIDTISIYYDPESSTIAFNRAQSLFFNFAYFLANSPGSSVLDQQRCMAFWFMTFCHELAHNFIGPHDAQHEFYMSAFAETYLPPLLQLMTDKK